MLNGKERKVMQYLYTTCMGKRSVLVDPNDILNYLQPKYEINNIELAEILNGLVIDNYIDIVNSDKNGKLIYCISLKAKGEGYEREVKNSKKKLYLLLTRTIILACISFAVTMILKAIFKF